MVIQEERKLTKPPSPSAAEQGRSAGRGESKYGEKQTTWQFWEGWTINQTKMEEILELEEDKGDLDVDSILDLNVGKFLKFSGPLLPHLEDMRNNTCSNPFTSLLYSTN